MKTLKNQTYKNQKFRQLVAAILLLSSTLGIISPVLAQVAAGSDIKNTATAKFKDDAGTVYNSTSNEIIIKVAEVAGINITAQTPSVTNPNAGDTLFVDYIISNTGNDPTQFFIPGTATLSDNTNFSQDGKIQIIAVNGTNLGAAVEVPNTGDTTGNLLTANGSIPANFGSATNGTITVRVPIKVAVGTASGTNLTVTLGNTNKPAPDNQNQDRSTDIDTDDFYTVDNADGTTSETNGTPGNGVREAMATSATITVNARQQAFSTVLKAVSSYSSGANANDISDDVLTYVLALKVENPASPPATLVVSDLYGTGIKVDGLTTTPYVLVSDAIPKGMKLGTANPVASSGWQVVYTTDDLAVNALNASWLTTRPSGVITRVGYVYDTTTTPLAKGSTTTGFSFTVTPDTGFTGEQITNIAQTFGQSKPGAVVPGTATQIVYDESGDQTSNNGLDGANPDSTTAGGVTPTNGGITDGKADIIADGVDPGTGNDPTANNTNQGNNTGTGAGTKTVGGEVNVYVITATPLNGPKDQPGATGPTGTNDDFTNKSIVVPADKNPTDTLTDTETTPITFDNTVKNTTGGSQVISLLPTPPTVTGDLLDGTKVTIKDGNGNTAIYTYTAANGFTFDSGTGTTAGNPISATNPIKVTVAAGDVASYQVIVDLPAAPQLKGFPVPITAFVDVNGDGKPAGEPSNITIDRVYTNYLELKKEARILEANGTPVSGAAGTFTINQADLAVAATPGRIIEYRITYTNISTTGGANSVILPVKDLVITENGSTGGNTWFSTTVDPKYSATVTQGSAVGTSVTVTTAANASVTDIQQYEDAIANVNPAGTGTFIFQRKIK